MLKVSNDLKGSLKDKNHTFAQKAELKTEGHEPGSEATLKGNAKEFEINYEWSPKELQPSVGQATVELQFKHGNDSSLEAECEVCAGGYDLGGLVPWSTLQLKMKRDAPKDGNCPMDLSVKWSETFKVDEWYVGWENTFDRNADRKYPYIKEAFALLAHKGQFGNFYMRTNCLENLIALGAWHKVDSSSRVAGEAIYDIKGNYKPNLRIGYEKVFDNKVKSHTVLNLENFG